MTATSTLAEVITAHCDGGHGGSCEGVAAAAAEALKVDAEASFELERLHGIALEHAGCGRVRADLDAANLRLNAFASDLDAVKVTAAEAALGWAARQFTMLSPDVAAKLRGMVEDVRAGRVPL